MTEMGTPFALDQYAAISCPVKTQNTLNPLVEYASTPGPVAALGPAAPPHTPEVLLPDPCCIDPDAVERFQETGSHRERVIRTLLNRHNLRVSDLRDHPPGDERIAAAVEAMSRGTDIIIGAELPVDWDNHRRGTADILLRAGDNSNRVYYPAMIKDHYVLAPTPAGQGVQLISSLIRPFLHQAHVSDYRFRVETHALDLMALVHLHHLLAAAGFAGETPWGAIIGTDRGRRNAGGEIAWVDLSQRQIRAFAYTSPHQWRRYSPVSRYQHEYRFRVRVATRALQQTGSPTDPELVASPVRIPECEMCEWWPTCQSHLEDDISVKIERSPLDAREIMTLRSLGISTITELATIDVDSLLPEYLPRVAHRTGAETRLRLAAHRGRLLQAGIKVERTSSGPINVPSADLEIDLDIETSANNRIYLWGFLVHDRRQPDSQPYYHHLAQFGMMTQDEELDLAETAAAWLRDLLGSSPDASSMVWHYSTYEPSALHRLAQLVGPASALSWLTEYSRDHFIDLLPIVKDNFFGVDGLGLKAVASEGAGFHWRDPEPSGLNSQYWFSDAVEAETAQQREQAEKRILDYNEDDVRATWTLRDWLRSLT